MRRKMKLIAVIGLAFMLAFTLAGGAVAAKPEAKADVLIGFDRQPGPAEEAIVGGAGGAIKYTYHLVPAIAASVPEAAIERLLKNPKVTRVEPDITVYAIDAELDNAWGVKRIGAGVVHAYNKGTGVAVAIIDTGVDYTHEDLDANFDLALLGYDFVNSDTDPMDDHGHGTHVAGTVAAEDNDVGVVGVAPEAKLYALKVLGADGSGKYSDVIVALQWSVDNGIQVTNNSYGSSGDPGETVKAAFDNAYAKGVIHVAAAGNSGNPPGQGDNVIYPARWASVIAVGATNLDDERAGWSSTGPDLELAAPGVDINSTLLGGGYGENSGTSMASPHVAGTAALVIAGEGLTNVEVRTRLQETADDLGPAGFDTKYGYGLVDADEAAPDTTPKEPSHDVAITSISVPSVVGQGDLVPVDVTVANEGTFEETTTVSLTDITDSVLIGSEIVTLAAGTALTLTFNWDTGYCALKDYDLEAKASRVEGETDADFVDNSKIVTVSVVEKKALWVVVYTDKDIYVTGDTVLITVKVTENTDLGDPVGGASVHVTILTQGKFSYGGDGTTNDNGIAQWSFKIKAPDGKGTFTVIADASKEGYEPGSDSTTFEVQ